MSVTPPYHYNHSNSQHTHITSHTLSFINNSWLVTFDEYFAQHVNSILSSAVAALLRHESRKFVWAEVSFFERWYREQSHNTRDAVQRLVEADRLVFVGGGWVQNDEANPDVGQVVEQVSEGHEWLRAHFGVTPRIAWQIDPFGHSSLTPALYANMGYEAIVLNRVHFALKTDFKRQKHMEFVWQPSKLLNGQGESGAHADIFAHVLHTHYSAPEGFDWEGGSPGISEATVADRAALLASTLKQRAEAFAHQRLLVPWGDDFKFQNAELQFSHMDLLMKHVNDNVDRYGMRLRYSILNDYFDDVLAEAAESQRVVPLYSADFFPYADNGDSYWTGYFTSRSHLKAATRATESLVRNADSALALARARSSRPLGGHAWHSILADMTTARRNCALTQHHDGITGTARQHVVDDYEQRLHDGRRAARVAVAASADVLLRKRQSPAALAAVRVGSDDPDRVFSCGAGNATHALVLQNSLGWERESLIEVLVSRDAPCVVVDADGRQLLHEHLPAWVFDVTSEASAVTASSAYVRLAFVASLAPVSLMTVFLVAPDAPVAVPAAHCVPLLDADTHDAVLENEQIAVSLTREGLLQTLYSKKHDLRVGLNQQLLRYSSGTSGAYIFRTSVPPARTSASAHHSVCVHRGRVVQEAVVRFSERLRFTVQLVRTGSVASLLGAMLTVNYDAVAQAGNEVMVRFETDLETNGSFATDNGMELVERHMREDPRPEHHFYPAIGGASLVEGEADGARHLVQINARPLGMASLGSGQLESALHRACHADDGRGLAQALADTVHSRAQTQLLFGTARFVEAHFRTAVVLANNPTRLIASADAFESRHVWLEHHRPHHAALSAPLPPSVHLLSLRLRDASSNDVVLRLQSVDEFNTDGSAAEVDVDGLFAQHSASDVRRATLSLGDDAAKASFSSMPSSKLRVAASYMSDDVRWQVIGEGKESSGSQNTQEAGVFISDSALALEEKNKKNVGRKLLSARSCGDDCRLQIAPLEIATLLLQLEESGDDGVPPPRQLLQRGAEPAAALSEATLAKLQPIPASTAPILVQHKFGPPRAPAPRRGEQAPKREAAASGRTAKQMIVFAPAGASRKPRPLEGAVVVLATTTIFVVGSSACERCEWLLDGRLVASYEKPPFDVGGENATLSAVLDQARAVSLTAKLACGNDRFVLSANFTAVAVEALVLTAPRRNPALAPPPVNGFVAVDSDALRWVETMTFGVGTLSFLLLLALLCVIERIGRRVMWRRRGAPHAQSDLPTTFASATRRKIAD